MNYQLKFVAPGTKAPSNLEPNELWFDVGGRFSTGVFDHHGGDTAAWSSTELVFQNPAALFSLSSKDFDEVIVHLHKGPDIDAIGAFWLASKIIDSKGEILNNKSVKESIKKISEKISENDQGLWRDADPVKSWMLIIKIIMVLDLKERIDEEKIEPVCKLLDETLDMLVKGREFENIAESFSTPRIKKYIQQARRDYKDDLIRASKFQVMLPIQHAVRRYETVEKIPQQTPERNNGEWGPVDGIVFENPKSALLKEFARNDETHSPLKQGFDFMVVSHTLNPETETKLFRHIISTDPITGFHLKGLGNMLEIAEQKKEDSNGITLPEQRKRLPDNSGRFGYNVESPWYDGRGHNFTIVDSPSIMIGGKSFFASHLTIEEVLDTVWNYSNPGKNIVVKESEITIILSVTLADDWKNHKFQSYNVSDEFSGLTGDVKSTIDDFSTFQKKCNNKVDDKYILSKQEVWEYETESALWVGSFTLINTPISIDEVIVSLNKLVNEHKPEWLPAYIRSINTESRKHLIHNRIEPYNYSLDDSGGYSSVITHKLATAGEDKYSKLPDSQEISELNKIFSRDHNYMAAVSDEGVAVISQRKTSFSNEHDFHRIYGLVVLCAIVLTQKISLDRLSARISDIRRKNVGFSKVSKDIIESRWELIKLEQEISLSRISEKRFGQSIYECLCNVHGLKSGWDEVKSKIEILEKQVNDTRSEFYQKLAFIVTILFAPLGVATGIMGGSQMLKNFSDTNITLVEVGWLPSGWFQFIIYFVGSCLILIAIWFLLYNLLEKSNFMNKLRKKR